MVHVGELEGFCKGGAGGQPRLQPCLRPQILGRPLASFLGRAHCTNDLCFLLSVWRLGSRTPGERDSPGSTQSFQSPQSTANIYPIRQA